MTQNFVEFLHIGSWFQQDTVSQNLALFHMRFTNGLEGVQTVDRKCIDWFS